MPRFVYAPGASDALCRPGSYALRADQTRLALFLFLRLGAETVIAAHFWNANELGSPLRRLAHKINL